ncbi:unnamed protein product, partial [Mesorhabditis belari]|uniref:Serine-threonine/tyrosine-protein kinase catalytic domain-containing protein n=1 Tax=Mesorhabditis belari TaxID=2138241 RepID=A0AAF3EIK7_9BILA
MIKHDQLSFDRTKDLLGTGNFANVYKGIYKIDDKMEKLSLLKRALAREAYTVEQLKKERESMLKEAETQVYYVHENVVRSHGTRNAEEAGHLLEEVGCLGVWNADLRSIQQRVKPWPVRISRGKLRQQD